MGGMGKTALAREAAAWWLQTRRFDAAVFVSLEQRPPAERVVQIIGEALNGERFSSKSAEVQWRWVVQAVRTGRVLLVWDNAESVLPQFQTGLESDLLRYSADDLARLRRLYADLTTHAPQSRLLITCRPAALEWPGLKLRPLKGLARADSQYVLRALLDRHAEECPPQHKRAELDALLDLLDDHPLSIELVGPHLLRRTHAQICQEFGALLDEFVSSEPDEERNRSLRASLAFSLRHLSDRARALLPWLAWFSGGVLETQVRVFTNLTPEALHPLRAELVSTALIRLRLILPSDALATQVEQRLADIAHTEREPAQHLGLETIVLLATIGTSLASIAASRAQIDATRAQIEAIRMETLKTMLEIRQQLRQQGQADVARVGAVGGQLRSFADADEAFLRELLDLPAA